MWRFMMFWMAVPTVPWLVITRLFPHPTFSNLPSECEGYYPDSAVCQVLGTTRPSIFRRNAANARCPQWFISEKWEGRDEFIEKLTQIEAVAKKWQKQLEEMTSEQIEHCGENVYTPPVFLHSQRGLAWSRMEAGVVAGNKEFRTTTTTTSGATEEENEVCWTSALLNLYVVKYGVEPSSSFKDFVYDFDLENYRKKFDTLKRCSLPSTTTPGTTTEF